MKTAMVALAVAIALSGCSFRSERTVQNPPAAVTSTTAVPAGTTVVTPALPATTTVYTR
jgi:hypothetical protein